MDHVHLQHHIVIHKISERRLIGFYATDFSGCKKHIVRLFSRKKFIDGLLVDQVELRVRTCDDIVVSLTFQLTDNSRTYHAAMACYINL